MRLPVLTIALGNPDPSVPAVGFFGGVHGLERIGAAVTIEYLRGLLSRLRWDRTLNQLFETVRLVFMPIVNPGGMLLGTRANPNGVDLMRNSPVQGDERVPFLLGGHRISADLPWYRGAEDTAMQPEAAALCEVVERELLGRSFSIAIDCHSGFGIHDRIWIPYAHTAEPIEHLAEMAALVQIFEDSHRSHRYRIEPQSRHYLTHGDLWDHLYERSRENSDRIFLPLTLEMGSWIWVRKNPLQLLSRDGIFNPKVGHRQQRVLRQHTVLLDFLTRAAASHAGWVLSSAEQANEREALRSSAMRRWYADQR